MKKLVAAVLALALAMLGLAFTPAAAYAAEPNSITGTVTDNDGQPVAHVFVTLYDSAGDYVTAGITEDAGTYSFPDLADGTYRLFAETGDTTELVPEYYADAQSLATATGIVLSGGTQAVADVQFALGAKAKGKVTNSIGSPIGTSVEATPKNGDRDSIAGTETGTGEYSFIGLAPDDYVLRVTDDADFFAPLSKTVTTAVGAPVTQDFVLTPVIPAFSEFTKNAALSGPTTVEAGKTYTWTLDDSGYGNDVYVILYSGSGTDPNYLGAARPDNDVATFTLTIPEDLPAGELEFTYSTYGSRGESRDVVRSTFPLTVTAAPSATATPTVPPTDAATVPATTAPATTAPATTAPPVAAAVPPTDAAVLPATGAGAAMPLLGSAVVLLLAGLGAVLVNRRRGFAKHR